MDGLINTLFSDNLNSEKSGSNEVFSWKYIAQGVLECTPHKNYTSSIVFSAGIHGNETAPIEILDQIVRDLFLGKLVLKERLLFILGNPQAIREGRRYIDNDLNRLFLSNKINNIYSNEANRVKEIELITKLFFDESHKKSKKYHYDLHTAIKTSILPTFALIPFQTEDYDKVLLENLESAELEGIVFHTTNGKTFTNYTSQELKVASATLELGKANPFGTNNLDDFLIINNVIRNIVSRSCLLKRQEKSIFKFKVISTMVKKDDSFCFKIDENIPNFSVINKGEVIAFDRNTSYQFIDKDVYLLFINSRVEVGQRAGLILEKI